MDLPNSQNDLEARFGFLLQPIKDLARNFDIDLVSSLGDYLNEVAKVTIRFTDGVTTLNFAEAAMIIQGSTSVYSQKVEYLYRLTFTVLDLLGNKRQQQQQQHQSANNVEHSQNAEDEQFLSLDDVGEANHTVMTDDNQDGSDMRDIAPVTPSVLLHPDDASRLDQPLTSRNGEVLGRSSDFRMNTSSLHTSGTMFFDLSQVFFFNSASLGSGMTSGQPSSRMASVDGRTRPLPEDLGVDEGYPPDTGNDSDDFEATAQEQPATVVQPPDDAIAVDRGTRRALLRRNEVREPNPEDVRDVWSLLDPHQVSSRSAEKPFRKGKVFSVPDRVSSVPNRKRKRHSLSDASSPLIPFCQLWNNNYFSRGLKRAACLPKTNTFPDFEGLLLKKVERQKLLHAKRKQRHRNAVMNEGRDEEEDLLFVRDGDNLAFGGAAAAADDDDDAADDDDDAEPVAMNFEIPDIPLEELLGSVRQDNGLENNFSESAVSLSYEDLVRRYIEGFMESAKHYVQTTALGQRVVEWENKIVPRLLEEEKRRPFDIHDYGTEVIEKIDSLGGSLHPVEFARVVEGKQRYEVCRYLLATLQLANFGNVDLGCPTDNSLKMDVATCKLLSRQRQFDELTEYRVPSFQQNGFGVK